MEINDDLVERILKEKMPRWSLVEEIGHGSYGTVYRVTDGAREAALKAFLLSARRRVESGSVSGAAVQVNRDWKRFEVDYKSLRCGALVGFQDFFLYELKMEKQLARAVGVVLMDFYPANLYDWVMDRFPLETSEVRRLFREVAGLLEQLHREKKFHYEDLKPENVLLEADGTGMVLGDFGGLRAAGSGSSQGQFNFGYAPPERLLGSKGRGVASVVYSLGLLGHWLAARKLPYEKEENFLARARRVAEEGIDLAGKEKKARLGDLVPVIERCLSWEAKDRYQDFGALVEAIDGRGGGEGIRTDGGGRTSSGGGLDRRTPPDTVEGLDLPEKGRAPGTVFRDAGWAPEMVVIPASAFVMGSPEDEEGRFNDEGPQHRVVFGEPFAMGRYAVTFAEWDACVAEGGCKGYCPDDRGWGRGKRPVINMSWEDAVGYAAWLSDRMGQEYRLPTEAEWEYACRAGTTTPFHFGKTISTDQANYDGNFVYGSGTTARRRSRWRLWRKGRFLEKTVPVGTYPANAFGLHEMHGNVWEWVEDCKQSYSNTPTDGSAETGSNSCRVRVLRGGSWDLRPRDLRSASRNRLTAGNRHDSVGFRVARTL